MFNLSLSSKELFHSNFLAWIAEDEDTMELFVSILKLFGLKNETAEDYAEGIRNGLYVVKREYNNFDFCICENIDNWEKGSKQDAEEKIPGRVLLVLENKFKSIPYKAQLEEYQTKVVGLNEQASVNEAKLLCLIDEPKKKPHGKSKIYQNKKEQVDKKYNGQKCHFVLLSLAKEVCGLTIEGQKPQRFIQTADKNKWHFVTYKEYSEKLKNQVQNQSGFKCNVILDYASYIDTFCKYLINKIPQDILKEIWTSILSSNSELVAIRMDDIWQKLIVNLIAVRFCEKYKKECVFGNDAKTFIENNNLKDKVHVASGFSRGTGLFEVKIKIDDECLFGIQIQDGYYKRLLETTEDKLKSPAASFYEDRLKRLSGMFHLSNHNPWIDPQGYDIDPQGYDIFDLDAEIHPTGNRPNRVFENFGGYGKTFICQSKKLSSDCTIEMVLNAVITDIDSAYNSFVP